jgi:hypothetical protein
MFSCIYFLILVCLHFIVFFKFFIKHHLLVILIYCDIFWLFLIGLTMPYSLQRCLQSEQFWRWCIVLSIYGRIVGGFADICVTGKNVSV